MISGARILEMGAYFWAESNDPESEAWREDLTAEEAELAGQWDEQVNAGFAALITRIHELEREV